MESVILEISLCLIENIIIYVFFNSLLKNRFLSPFPLIIAIVTNSLANYLCSNFNMFFKIPLALVCLLIGASILYKEFIKESAGALISTKTDKALHGYGTQIISDIAQKYDGSYSWEAQDNKFVSTVLIKI